MSVDDSEFFREVTLRITSSLEIERALGNSAAVLERAIPIDVITLQYFDPQRQAIYAMASYSKEHGCIGYQESPVLRIDQDRLDRLRLEGASVHHDRPTAIFNSTRDDPIFNGISRFLTDLGLADFSSLFLRLDIGEDYQGVLIVAAAGLDVYTEEHARLIQTVEEPLAIAMSNARRYRDIVDLTEQLADDNRAMYRDLEQYSGGQVVGAEYGLRHVMELVANVAPTNSPVLLMGDTGTGKEVVANAIHAASPRSDGPMVRVQCGTFPETVLDSELFGHEKGAFTGATQVKRGRFERADGGTIFFDEIGELTLEAQVKLLGVLENKEFERLGGTKTISVDARVIVATNRNLQAAVQEKTFREDLWFRLNVFPIQLPPLRQRKQDIPALVQWFVDRKSREMGLPARPILTPDAMEQLLAYTWPGNVRELQNVIERAIILSRGGPLVFADLGPRGEPETPAAPSIDRFPPLDSIVADHIRQALSLAEGRVQGKSGAARLLGVNPSTLRARMRRLRIPFGCRRG